MNILILQQDFAMEKEQAPDGIFGTGRRLVSRGDNVTVIAGNSLLKLPLENKKICLLQKEGVAVIVLNVQYSEQMKFIAKCGADYIYARQAVLQGQRLPRPDMIVASSPPLTAAYAALLLSRRYRVPLILLIRELWPEELIKRGELNSKTLLALFRRMEEKIYRGATSIIAASAEIAEAVAVRGKTVTHSKIHILDENLPESEYSDRLQELLL